MAYYVFKGELEREEREGLQVLSTREGTTRTVPRNTRKEPQSVDEMKRLMMAVARIQNGNQEGKGRKRL